MQDMFVADSSDDTLERLIFDGHALQNVLIELNHTVGSIDPQRGIPTRLQLRLTLGQLLGIRRDLDQLIGKVGQAVTAQCAEPDRCRADLIHHSTRF